MDCKCLCVPVGVETVSTWGRESYAIRSHLATLDYWKSFLQLLTSFFLSIVATTILRKKTRKRYSTTIDDEARVSYASQCYLMISWTYETETFVACFRQARKIHWDRSVMCVLHTWYLNASIAQQTLNLRHEREREKRSNIVAVFIEHRDFNLVSIDRRVVVVSYGRIERIQDLLKRRTRRECVASVNKVSSVLDVAVAAIVNFIWIFPRKTIFRLTRQKYVSTLN